jgi:hypothetical protein
MNLQIRRYDPAMADLWNALVASSKNGPFLFDRRYMDYHADRFHDVSAVAFDGDDMIAAMPASLHGEDAVSHGGLTFGGLVVRPGMRTPDILSLFEAVCQNMATWGVRNLTVKPLPAPFCTQPSAELDYAMWSRGFQLSRRDIASIVPLRHALGPTKAKLRDARRATKIGCEIRDTSVGDFYPLLQDVLRTRHDTDPVHSLAELAGLQNAFPQRLVVRCAWLGGKPVAGTLLFRYDGVWHTQYLAASEAGRDANALDLVISTVIEEAAAAGAECFSFGTSMTDGNVNERLLWQKESFGARTILFDSWTGRL